jgi:hypothetical protein
MLETGKNMGILLFGSIFLIGVLGIPFVITSIILTKRKNENLENNI